MNNKRRCTENECPDHRFNKEIESMLNSITERGNQEQQYHGRYDKGVT